MCQEKGFKFCCWNYVNFKEQRFIEPCLGSTILVFTTSCNSSSFAWFQIKMCLTPHFHVVQQRKVSSQIDGFFFFHNPTTPYSLTKVQYFLFQFAYHFFSIEFEFNPIQSYFLIMKLNIIIKFMKLPIGKLKVIHCNQNLNIRKIIRIHPMNEHRYQVSNPHLSSKT